MRYSDQTLKALRSGHLGYTSRGYTLTVTAPRDANGGALSWLRDIQRDLDAGRIMFAPERLEIVAADGEAFTLACRMKS